MLLTCQSSTNPFCEHTVIQVVDTFEVIVTNCDGVVRSIGRFLKRFDHRMLEQGAVAHFIAVKHFVIEEVEEKERVPVIQLSEAIQELNGPFVGESNARQVCESLQRKEKTKVK